MRPVDVIRWQVRAAYEIAKLLNLKEIVSQIKRFEQSSILVGRNCALCLRFYEPAYSCPRCVYGKIKPPYVFPEAYDQVQCFKFSAAILGENILAKSNMGLFNGLFTDSARQLLFERYCMAWLIRKGK